MFIPYYVWVKEFRYKKKALEEYEESKQNTQDEFDKLLDDHFAKKFTDLFKSKGKKIAFNFVDQIKNIRQRSIDAEIKAKSNFKMRSLNDPKNPPHILFILVDDLGRCRQYIQE